jgi:hypothetical protein
MDGQVWKCGECGDKRVYGAGPHASADRNSAHYVSGFDPTYRPALSCSHCNRVTRHEFFGYTEVQEKEHKLESRFEKHSFPNAIINAEPESIQ